MTFAFTFNPANSDIIYWLGFLYLFFFLLSSGSCSRHIDIALGTEYFMDDSVGFFLIDFLNFLQRKLFPVLFESL